MCKFLRTKVSGLEVARAVLFFVVWAECTVLVFCSIYFPLRAYVAPIEPYASWSWGFVWLPLILLTFVVAGGGLGALAVDYAEDEVCWCCKRNRFVPTSETFLRERESLLPVPAKSHEQICDQVCEQHTHLMIELLPASKTDPRI